MGDQCRSKLTWPINKQLRPPSFVRRGLRPELILKLLNVALARLAIMGKLSNRLLTQSRTEGLRERAFPVQYSVPHNVVRERENSIPRDLKAPLYSAIIDLEAFFASCIAPNDLISLESPPKLFVRFTHTLNLIKVFRA